MNDTDLLAAYSFRLHAFAPERAYGLYTDRLVWTDVDAKGVETVDELALADIVELELKYAPSSYLLGRCIAVAVMRKGGALTIASSHYLGVANLEDRTGDYEPFVRALAAQLAEANPRARFVRGYRRSSLLLGAILGAFGLMLFIALLPIMFAVGLPAVIPIGILLVFGGPAAVAEIRRNWPGVYDPRDIPPDLLPGARVPAYVNPGLAKVVRLLMRR